LIVTVGHLRIDWRIEHSTVLTVAYLGYDRHGTSHRRNFDVGAKIAWEKLKFIFLQFLEPLFCVPYNHKLQS